MASCSQTRSRAPRADMGLLCCDGAEAFSTRLACELLPAPTSALQHVVAEHFAPEKLLYPH